MWIDDSVTRWLNYLIIISPFITLKIRPITRIFPKLCLTYCWLLNGPLKDSQSCSKFCQIGEFLPNRVTLIDELSKFLGQIFQWLSRRWCPLMNDPRNDVTSQGKNIFVRNETKRGAVLMPFLPFWHFLGPFPHPNWDRTCKTCFALRMYVPYLPIYLADYE